jgi:hypothetical protein
MGGRVSAFEFFFSFYGLVVGLSVAVIATGLATAIQHRKKIRIGWLTLLLALFVGLDIATFWDSAWNTFRDAPYNYGMLVAGMTIALVYFVAASLVFPHEITDGMDMDDHFWANKKVVLLLTTLATILMLLVSIPQVLTMPGGTTSAWGLLALLGLYIVMTVPAALTRNRKLFAVLIGLHVALYLASAAVSPFVPETLGPPAAAPAA